MMSTSTKRSMAPAAPANSLQGVRVVVTHAPDQADKLSALLATSGADVYHYPAIEILPFSQNDDFDTALRDAAAGKYDWLILNDADMVPVVAERLEALKIEPRTLARTKIATIGCMTEQFTHEMLGLQSSFSPDEYSPQFVAEALRLELGDRVLLPQSAMTRAALAKCLVNTGADVTPVNAYRTVIGHGGDPVPLLLWEGKIDAVAFTGPTAVRYFAKRLKAEDGDLAMLDDVCVACIGPITTDAARSLGLRVAFTPKDHTIEGLVGGLAAYFEKRAGR